MIIGTSIGIFAGLAIGVFRHFSLARLALIPEQRDHYEHINRRYNRSTENTLQLQVKIQSMLVM
jgi:hypothetical protein